MNIHQDDNASYSYILKTLEGRAKKTRRNVFVLIYFLVIVVAGVILIAYNIKNTSNSPLANAISAAIDSNNRDKLNTIILRASSDQYLIKVKEGLNSKSLPKERADKVEKEVKSMTDDEVDKQLLSNWSNYIRPYKSTSEKIAESIASLFISLSILMFIAYVMRVLLVFIKYYMQLGADHENQQMAFMMSKGDHEMFSKNLSLFRAHNINLEKTPSMPQEKLIMGLIDIAKNAKDSMKKSKEE
ncbi:hypothetical protein [Pantoea agglomerans]|uniref:hypothetical protein n=1 Tax=Enterobacter agglomerans TaxID=549 RepID=UPI000DAF26FA|nr:hypothetical protein [Pantoea agglomerans]RAH29125.1 hypothetical protein DOT37_15225 [Pantoea agglomerans]TGX90764.1 hypothetical protein E5821_16740 [Pantoea agglomerans]